jgi:hypothetical protein
MVPDAHDKTKSHPPIMFTTDLALKFDPEYAAVSKRFLDNPKEFELAFAKAWFKLTHRDMGPRARYIGSEVPQEALIWQDPIPTANYKLIGPADITALKVKILGSGLTSGELVRTAWASAASFRGTDKRGGANGARIRLAPEKDWPVNDPAEVAKVVAQLETLQKEFNKRPDGVKVSLADQIVLGGSAAIEKAAKAGGFELTVPFKPGREPVGHVDEVAEECCVGGNLRRGRSGEWCAEVDCQAGRFGVRVALRAPRGRRGLRGGRREAEVRARLRPGMGEGDDARPVRRDSVSGLGCRESFAGGRTVRGNLRVPRIAGVG